MSKDVFHALDNMLLASDDNHKRQIICLKTVRVFLHMVQLHEVLQNGIQGQEGKASLRIILKSNKNSLNISLATERDATLKQQWLQQNKHL